MDRIERYYLRQSEGGFATPGFICNNRKCLENNNKKKASPPKGYKVRKGGKGVKRIAVKAPSFKK